MRVAWQRVKEQLGKFQSLVLASFFTYYWKAIFVCTRFSALSPSCVMHFNFFFLLIVYLFLSRWYCLSYCCWFIAFNEKLRSKGLSFCMILQVLMYLKAEEKVFLVYCCNEFWVTFFNGSYSCTSFCLYDCVTLFNKNLLVNLWKQIFFVSVRVRQFSVVKCGKKTHYFFSFAVELSKYFGLQVSFRWL